MEFTEVEELNNIALQARSFMPGQLLPASNATYPSYRPPTDQPTAPILMFDYEKILEDTPPESPSKYFSTNKSGALQLLKIDTEETVEGLLLDIKNSLTEYTEINVSLEPPIAQPKLEEKRPSVNIPEESSPIADKVDPQLHFEKAGEEFVSKSYMETKNLRSFLSTSIKNYPMNKEYNTARRAEIKTFKVYFLGEKNSTLLPISLASTVTEVIKQCLEAFKLNKAINELIKNPDRPDAYDLQKDMVSGPLDRQKPLKELKIAREIIVVESKSFDASRPYVETKGDSTADPQNSLLFVVLHLPTDDRACANMQMGGDRQLKDIFGRLALEGRTGFNIQQYNVRLYASDPETRWKESKNFLDTNIPLKNIKSYESDAVHLELVKKKFADEPNEAPTDHRASPASIRKSGTVDITHEQQEDQIILYNEVSANHYEEFEVTKINENGKKQERILGIDGFKLYNYSRSYKQDQNGRIGEMFTSIFFSKFGTLNPERLFTDVVDARLLGAKIFQIGVKAEGRTKMICYEAIDSRVAKQIVAKINYLKGIQEKKNTGI